MGVHAPTVRRDERIVSPAPPGWRHNLESNMHITPEQIIEYSHNTTREQAERLARQINQQ